MSQYITKKLYYEKNEWVERIELVYISYMKNLRKFLNVFSLMIGFL